MTVIPQIVENQNSLMKKCLEFYADEKNWKGKPNQKSLVEADAGFLAAKTLKDVEDLQKQNKDFSDQYEAMQNTTSADVLKEAWKVIDEITKEE